MGRWQAWIILLTLTPALSLASPNWEKQVPLSSPRSNPYNLSPSEFEKFKHNGQLHAQIYPVAVTGVLLPERPLKKILDNSTWNPIKGIFNEIFKEVSGFKSFDSLFEWVGLVPYPKSTDPLAFQVALPEGKRPEHRLGYSPVEVNGTRAFTMSCATCHSDQLFGQTVMGMSKRFPRANSFFIKGQKAFKFYDPFLFRLYSGATPQEMELLDRSITNLGSVGSKRPLTLGLDTSLAQVALSLKKRKPNEWADKSDHYENHPRADWLDTHPADSKPAVWWNLKYKNRWLSDGSVLSGNPIYTNLLWNEIGRGTDLRELDQWLKDNPEVIEELTTAAFSTEAPRFEDFFSEDFIEKESALRGEALFNNTCARCHGQYIKNWSQPEFQNSPWKEQIKTFKVVYHPSTFVVDVGTDPYRREGMKSLEALNDLKISQNNGITVQAQSGYVPPPLVGIWARWPYMHNNSIPTLCDVLSPADARPEVYHAGAPVDKERDFDLDCNGYPQGWNTPWRWKQKPEYKFDTRKAGMGNRGHDRGIFILNGQDIFSARDKKDLIRFLQTL